MSDRGPTTGDSLFVPPADEHDLDGKLSDLEERLATSEAHLIALEKELRHSAGVLKQMRRDLRTVSEDQKARSEAFAAQSERINLLTLVLHEAEQSIRREISYRLHEDLRQILYGAQVQLRTVLNNLTQAPSWDDKEVLLEEARWLAEIMEQALHTTQSLSTSLVPPVAGNAKLSDTSAALKQQMGEMYDLEVEFEIEEELDSLDKSLSTLIYHLLRIFLINVANHADTDRASAKVTIEDDRIVAHIHDRGKGFDPRLLEGESYVRSTINNVRRRLQAAGGDLVVNSIPGDGTRVTATLPIET